MSLLLCWLGGGALGGHQAGKRPPCMLHHHWWKSVPPTNHVRKHASQARVAPRRSASHFAHYGRCVAPPTCDLCCRPAPCVCFMHAWWECCGAVQCMRRALRVPVCCCLERMCLVLPCAAVGHSRCTVSIEGRWPPHVVHWHFECAQHCCLRLLSATPCAGSAATCVW